jgi:hypothetical protein
VLGIAALLGAMVTIALLILLTQDGETQRVKPLPKDTATHQRGGDEGGEVVLGDPWIGGSSSRSRNRARKGKRHGRTDTGGATLLALSADDRKTRNHRPSGAPRTPVAQPISPPGPTVPGPSGPPAQPVSPGTPPSSSEPVSTEPVDDPDNDPISPSAPDTHLDASDVQGVVIEDGEIGHGSNRVQSHGGHVRLRIRSDQLVLVEVEDRALRLVPAGGDALIEFGTSEKSFKLELRHRTGGLVLRLRD